MVGEAGGKREVWGKEVEMVGNAVGDDESGISSSAREESCNYSLLKPWSMLRRSAAPEAALGT